MRKMRGLLAVMAVASVVGGFTAYATPIDRPGAAPEPSSALIAVANPEMSGYECYWYKRCKYCRACARCHWFLVHCKKHRR